MKKLLLAILVLVVAGLLWWWFSMQRVEAPTTEEQGAVQGAVEINVYEDNSKDGAPAQ